MAFGRRFGSSSSLAILAGALMAVPQTAGAAPRKQHSVYLGAVKHVPYSQQGDPAGAAAGEDSLAIRSLVVNGTRKEWTAGETHDVTDRSFVVRRAVRLNNSLPGDKQEQWVWQRGPWLLVDRSTGHIAALKLPDYDPAVSRVVWFRDYAAYCGVTPSGKSLYAVVAQLAVRKPVLSKKLEAFNAAQPDSAVCGPPEWQRDPARVIFYPSGKDPVSYDIVPGSAMLVEDDSVDADASGAAPKQSSSVPADAPSVAKSTPSVAKSK